MTTLCDTFRKRACWTWGQLARAGQCNVRLGEESLTDFNLLEIKSRHSSEIITTTFSKPAEAKNGADWEWWLMGSHGRWLGFRLQAKVIDPTRKKFEHLYYQRKGRARQVDLLCNNANLEGYHRIPLYCLYTQWPASVPAPDWPCGSFAARRKSYGCSLVDACLIRKSAGSANASDLEFLLPKMMPWHCLVCCHGCGGDDLPSRALAVWRNRLSPTPDASITESAITGQPPNYVLTLLKEGRLVDPPDADLRTVTILREEATG